MKSFLPNPISCVAFLVGLAVLTTKPASGQFPECLSCYDDDVVQEHWTSILGGYGWHDEPHGYHPWRDDGWCLWTHYAGCFPEEEEDSQLEEKDLVRLVASSEGDRLRKLLADHPDRLTLAPDRSMVGFLGCPGPGENDPVYWLPLRDKQIQALKDQ